MGMGIRNFGVNDKLKKLITWRNTIAQKEINAGETEFLGKPDYWFKTPSWFCVNGHVSETFLKCEEDGDLCLACFSNVILGPPNITEVEFKLIVNDIVNTR